MDVRATEAWRQSLLVPVYLEIERVDDRSVELGVARMQDLLFVL
jgi:hypothetical protein